MALELLAAIDFSPWDEPEPDLEPRQLLESWLRYQRHEFVRKLRDLPPRQLVAWPIPPVELSVLGLVRHGCSFALRSVRPCGSCSRITPISTVMRLGNARAQ
jgi:hypothetical protein